MAGRTSAPATSRTKATTVSEYIASQPPKARAALRRVRAAIRKAAPGGDEVISYGIAAYKLNGRIMMFFAGWAQHYSVYPATRPLVTALKDELAGYELSKGTIRFPLTEPVPVRLIEKIARFKAAESADRARRLEARKKKH